MRVFVEIVKFIYNPTLPYMLHIKSSSKGLIAHVVRLSSRGECCNNLRKMDNGQSLENYERDFVSFQKEIPKLRETNPDQFIAFKEGKVISTGFNIEDVKKELISKNIEPSGTVIEFVPKEEMYLVI